MSSPTTRRLGPADVIRLARASFGPSTTVIECAELPGGGFAAVWRVRLADGRQTVLKVSPPPDVPLLAYERDLIAAEAAYYRLVATRLPGVPVPTVLHHGTDRSVLDGDWLFTAFLPGTPLAEWHRRHPALDDAPVRRQLGALVARLHTVTGPRFGYPGLRAHGSGWTQAFTAMVDELLDDGVRWTVELPASTERIRELVQRHAGILDLVTRPALVHFDLWDGNVLARPEADGTVRLTGLVDGERYLFGDPLFDLVSPALFGRIEDDPQHPFLTGYTGGADLPPWLDAAARRRLALYRMHLYLLMTVEMPSRGMTGEADRPRYDLVTRLLDEELTTLGRPLP
ncbi:aminoglycoside phosphotransferase family protein [Micromonospora sp. CPCC 206060]|uniref:phosphotransferase family protein n=1 Tax=Micromonospora sp. CPCC 206060 TaxID=3122406 RepID=UPI002FF3A38D